MDDYRDDIARGLQALGIPATRAVVIALADHLLLLDAANREMNLTRIDSASAVDLHLMDSLLGIGALCGAPPGTFADLGSGGGFPGIPLAVVSGRPVALVESVRKKAEFLKRVVAELRLEATVHAVRAEEMAEDVRGSFSACTARALSSLPSIIELAAPLLRPDGLLIAFKARIESEELQRGRAAAALCGMSSERLIDVELPGSEAVRSLVVYQKLGAARVDLPRRPGMAQRKPLA